MVPAPTPASAPTPAPASAFQKRPFRFVRLYKTENFLVQSGQGSFELFSSFEILFNKNMFRYVRLI